MQSISSGGGWVFSMWNSCTKIRSTSNKKSGEQIVWSLKGLENSKLHIDWCTLYSFSLYMLLHQLNYRFTKIAKNLQKGGSPEKVCTRCVNPMSFFFCFAKRFFTDYIESCRQSVNYISACIYSVIQAKEKTTHTFVYMYDCILYSLYRYIFINKHIRTMQLYRNQWPFFITKKDCLYALYSRSPVPCPPSLSLSRVLSMTMPVFVY